MTVTKNELATRKLAQMKGMLEFEISSADRALEKFKARLEVDPAGAFEWADAAFAGAATKAVASYLLMMVEGNAEVSEEQRLDTIRKATMLEALRQGGRVSSSTSGCSNRMDDEKRAAWARMAEKFAA